MRSGAPWHIKGVHPDVRDSAREAARRAGMSVGQWLNSVILDSANDADGDDGDYFDDAYPPLIRRLRRDARSLRAMPSSTGGGLTEIKDRLDDLTDEIERLARAAAAPREILESAQSDETARRLADAIARLDQRVEAFIEEGRNAAAALGQKVESVDRVLSGLGREKVQPVAASGSEMSVPGGDWTTSIDQACDQIARRQRELEGEIFSTPVSPMLAADFGRVAGARAREDFSAIHDRLKEVSDQVEAFGAAKMREAVDALRNDLAEIAGKLTEASPRRAIEALEREVRQLSARVDSGMRTGAQTSELAGIEAGLAEVRGAIKGLAPAESLSGAVEAIRVLSQKIDDMAVGVQDPGGLQQLEAAVAGLRGIVSRVASDDSLAALTAEVRTLSARVDAGLTAVGAGSSDILRTLEQRIGTIADAIETVRVSSTKSGSADLEKVVHTLSDKLDRLQIPTEQPTFPAEFGAMFGSLAEKIDRLRALPEHPGVPPELGAMIGSLGERIDRIPVAPAATEATDRLGDMIGTLNEKIEDLRAARGDNAILRQIEERIGRLTEKLEASEARLGNLDNVEKGMKELLGYLEGLRRNPPVSQPVESPPVQHLFNDVIRTQESLEAAHGTIGDVVDRLAVIETGMRRTVAPPLAPADSEEALPPRTPSRMTPPPEAERSASRIDDVFAPDRPLEPGSGKPRPGTVASPSGAGASAAERIAVSKAVAEGVSNKAADADQKTSFIMAARRAAQAATEENAAAGLSDPAPASFGKKGQSLGIPGKHLKSIIVGLSIAIIAAGAIHLAFSFLNSNDRAGSGLPPPPEPEPNLSQNFAPNAGSAGVLNVAPPSTAGANMNAGVLAQSQTLPAPALPILVPTAQPGLPPSLPLQTPSAPTEMTGAVNGNPTPRVSQSPPAVPVANRTSALPAAIGSKTLISAAENGDVTAAYEIAVRFADGRGVPLNPEAAAVWFDRAAKGGIVPAMFRLGSLYEKGIGVKKDINKARELYVASADRGSAKAMHNLAVLYADGFDGKPDYVAAIQWFRKAGARGVPDSQYNLGVLFARGIGVEQNFSESYRWFALAAQSGDHDAAQKRDDVAKRLDSQALSAVRAAVQSWTPEPQPEDAVTVKTPPGGWDAAAPAASPKPRAKRV